MKFQNFDFLHSCYKFPKITNIFSQASQPFLNPKSPKADWLIMHTPAIPIFPSRLCMWTAPKCAIGTFQSIYKRANNHQLKRFLIVKDILIVSTLGNVLRTAWKKYILVLECKGLRVLS